MKTEQADSLLAHFPACFRKTFLHGEKIESGFSPVPAIGKGTAVSDGECFLQVHFVRRERVDDSPVMRQNFPFSRFTLKISAGLEKAVTLKWNLQFFHGGLPCGNLHRNFLSCRSSGQILNPVGIVEYAQFKRNDH